jgi:hypothetical protein
MRKALLAAAAITVLGSASAMAQATTTTDNPQNGTSADKMSPSGTPGTAANPTTANPTTMAPANTPQTATQPVPKDGPSFIQVQSGDMLTSNIVGLDIYNSQNDDIGKVTRYVAVNPDALMVSYDAQNKVWKATMNATKDQLKSAPEFKYGGQWTASRS